MTPIQRFTIFLVCLTLGAKIGFAKIYSDSCSLVADPKTKTIDLLNLCVNANASSWYTHKSRTVRNQQPDIRHHADGNASLFVTSWVSAHVSGYTDVYISRQNQETTHRDSRMDSYSFQIGNNAISRHRVNFGKGRVKFKTDHNQRAFINQNWNINSLETPRMEYVTYTYDNQLDWISQFTYGRLLNSSPEFRHRVFGAVRMMYDISALEGTRLSFAAHGDGQLHRAANIGILNINGKGDETCLEISRSFQNNPYDPREFKQLITLSYLSHLENKTRINFQYDDEFRHVRLGSLGGIYHFHKYAQTELKIGYAKYEDASAPSHWFTSMSVGAHL